MKNKKIILSLILVIVMCLGICTKINKKTYQMSVENKKEIYESTTKLEYEEAYTIAITLYKTEENYIEVEDSENNFIIYVKNDKGQIMNIFELNKVTEEISEITNETEEMVIVEESIGSDSSN